MTRSGIGFPGLGAYCPSNLIGPPAAPAATPASVDPLFVGEVIAALGRADFPVRFAQACQSLFGAVQTTAFLLADGRADCIFAARRDGVELAADRRRFYALQYEARDPFLAELAADTIPAAAVQSHYRDGVVRCHAVEDAGYRQRMFIDAGADAKIAILFRQATQRYYFNFYVRGRVGSGLIDLLAVWRDHRTILSETLAAFGRTLAEQPPPADVGAVERALRQRFPILSRREAEVCALTAIGSSVEDIAAGLAISPATVATFRRRAYAKIGIGSQKELFARLASQVLPPSLAAAGGLANGR
ncbi:MAG: helix-turn-helix transcriptional regulator [Lautropia sp.]